MIEHNDIAQDVVAKDAASDWRSKRAVSAAATAAAAEAAAAAAVAVAVAVARASSSIRRKRCVVWYFNTHCGCRSRVTIAVIVTNAIVTNRCRSTACAAATASGTSRSVVTTASNCCAAKIAAQTKKTKYMWVNLHFCVRLSNVRAIDAKGNIASELLVKNKNKKQNKKTII